MNRKNTLDMAIVISCMTGMVLSFMYLENLMERRLSLAILGTTGLSFLVLAVADTGKRAGQGDIIYLGLAPVRIQ